MEVRQLGAEHNCVYAGAPAGMFAASCMKRFVWILIAVFCTAFMPVQPVERLAAPKACCCKHCRCKDGCGGSGAACPMAAVPVLFAADRPAGVASLAPVRRSLPSRAARVKFFVSFVEPRAATAGLAQAARAAPAAFAPLFKAHCSFLI
jgi:hypothetical protein